MKKQLVILVLAAGAARLTAAAAPAIQVTVETDRPGAKINPAMCGVFFEDINFGADGGKRSLKNLLVRVMRKE